MILTIAKKECRERFRDGQFRYLSLAVLLLLGLSSAIGLVQREEADRIREEAQRKDRAQWLNQGARNPHSAAHFGVYAFKPGLALSFLDTGLDPFTGTAIWVEAHYQNPARFRPVEGATALARFGELTPAVVMGWFLPLLVVLMSFSAFTAEKEQGTLRLLLAQGVPPGTLAMGKAVGVAGALAVVLGPAVLLVLLPAADSWRRMLPVLAAYGCYLLVFAGVGLAVSAVVRTSRTAFVVLTGMWVFSTFAVPRLSADVAAMLFPTPSSADFWREIAAGMKGADGHSENDRRILELKQRTMEKYGVTKAEDLPVNFEGLRLQAGEEHGNHLFDEYYGRLWGAYEAQERAQQWTGLLSPYLAVRSISMAMAGTDLAHLRRFTEYTEEYRRALNKAMNLNVANRSRMGEYYYFAGADLWRSIPEFAYAAPEVWWAVRRLGLPAGILIGWLAIALVGLRLAVGRMGPA